MAKTKMGSGLRRGNGVCLSMNVCRTLLFSVCMYLCLFFLGQWGSGYGRALLSFLEELCK